MSEQDAAQDAKIEATKATLERHLDDCSKRSAAVWTEISKLRDDIRAVDRRQWLILIGIVGLLLGEAGIFNAVLGS